MHSGLSDKLVQNGLQVAPLTWLQQIRPLVGGHRESLSIDHLRLQERYCGLLALTR